MHIAEERLRVLAATTSSYSSSSYSSSNSTPATAPVAVNNNKPVCESLEARVAQLDSMARQPQSGEMQDWIRSERQKTRDEQFRLRC